MYIVHSNVKPIDCFMEYKYPPTVLTAICYNNDIAITDFGTKINNSHFYTFTRINCKLLLDHISNSTNMDKFGSPVS